MVAVFVNTLTVDVLVPLLVIEFCFLLGKMTIITFYLMKTAYGSDCLSNSKGFLCKNTLLDNKPQKGHHLITHKIITYRPDLWKNIETTSFR